jgi:tetratricopeptide (TPR) repeat protein
MRDLAQAALQAWRAGDAPRAEELARRILDLAPNDPNARQVLGNVCLSDGRIGEAVGHFRSASAAAPRDPRILNMLGVALRRAGDLTAARTAYASAGEMGLAEAWRNLANLERMANNIDAAFAAYDKALELQPDLAAAHAGLAQLHERRHDLDPAKLHAEQALKAEPNNELALIALGRIRLRERDWKGALDLLTPLGRDARIAPVNRAIAIGLAGEALEQSGDAPGAFQAFTAANIILRQLHVAELNDTASPFHPHSVRRFIRFVDGSDAGAWRHPNRFETPAPVFLVGFPRSGTTLLDQVLSSHPGIVCLEEKEVLAATVADLVSENAKDALGNLSPSLIDRLRRSYWSKAEAEADIPLSGRLLVDKMPLNLIFLPAIARIFPDAKIILALRDPRAVVLSCYQQRFGMNPAMAQMLDLVGAAAYYDDVMTLMERCRARLPLRVHEVRYEDLVADLEAVARSLAGFLQLPFDPAMLDFNVTARRRQINTPSARQVIEPLYAHSVARWRAYARDLAPALPLLRPWAVRFGYPD